MSYAPVGTLPELGLLERAIGYARAALAVAPEMVGETRTPCAQWTLTDLLTHMNASVLALEQAASAGGITVLEPPRSACSTMTVDAQVARLRTRACALLDSWLSVQPPAIFGVGGSELQAGLLASAGALEITVHGWDVGRSCSLDHPIPPALAQDLLTYVPLLVSDSDRPRRFAPPLATDADSTEEEELLAILGRCY